MSLAFFLAVAAFPLAGFAFGRVAVVSDRAFEAAEGSVAAKALEIDFRVIVCSLDADRGI